MTGESKSETEAWIEDKGAEYAYMYASNMDGFMRAIDGGGYPSSALIDASGMVVWSGHPSSLTSALIEEHLVGALRKPLFEWPKAASKIAKSVRAGDLGGAIREAKAYAEKGGELGAELLADLQASLTSRLDFLNQRFEAGDFLTVLERGESLLPTLEEGEPKARLQKHLEHLATDTAAQNCIEGQRAWRKLVGKSPLRKVKDCEKRIEDLKKLAEKYTGTFAAEEIERQIGVARATKTKLLER